VETASLQVMESAPGSAPRPEPESPVRVFAGDGLRLQGNVERFDSKNLSNKIDGKAELYLSAGFVQLSACRFTLEESPEAYLEFFVYQMEGLREAFAVYSNQRRTEARPLDLTRFAYASKNSVHFVHGPYYVEMVAGEASPALVKAMTDAAGRFVERISVREEEIAEIQFFPETGLDHGGIVLYAESAFGFQRFDSVFAAPYRRNGTRLTAYLTRRADAGKAEDLLQAYADFMKLNGAEEKEPPAELSGARMYELFGTWELFFATGRYFAGVRECGDRAATVELGRDLKRRLREDRS
jgi:hypothetical protein